MAIKVQSAIRYKEKEVVNLEGSKMVSYLNHFPAFSRHPLTNGRVSCCLTACCR